MIAAAGGLVLLVCMFLPWFGGERVGRGGALVAVPTTTGWEAYSGVFDVLIVVLVAVPIGIAVARANDADVRLPLEQWFAVMAAGAILLLLVVVRLIDPPDVLNVAVPGLEIDVSRKLAGVRGCGSSRRDHRRRVSAVSAAGGDSNPQAPRGSRV